MKSWSSRFAWQQRAREHDSALATEAMAGQREIAREEGRSSFQLAGQLRQVLGDLLDRERVTTSDVLRAARALEALSRAAPEVLPAEVMPALPPGPTPPGQVGPCTGRRIPEEGSEEELERVGSVLATLEECGYISISEPNSEPGSAYMRRLAEVAAVVPDDDITLVEPEAG